MFRENKIKLCKVYAKIVSLVTNSQQLLRQKVAKRRALV